MTKLKTTFPIYNKKIKPGLNKKIESLNFLINMGNQIYTKASEQAAKEAEKKQLLEKSNKHLNKLATDFLKKIDQFYEYDERVAGDICQDEYPIYNIPSIRNIPDCNKLVEILNQRSLIYRFGSLNSWSHCKIAVAPASEKTELEKFVITEKNKLSIS